MDLQPWYYFLTIERDFIKTLDFVQFHADNEKTHSNEFVKLLLLIGSEVDVVAKMLCKSINPTRNTENITQHGQIICGQFPQFHTIEIDITRYAHSVKPWLNWGATPSASPTWWKAHTDVKHHRDQHFLEANLKNTTDALCGLLALLMYLYEGKARTEPYPELLNYGFPESVFCRGTKKLPDF